MTSDREAYPFSEAVRQFWLTRENQASRQTVRGVADQGARSAVTGGAQMAGFAQILANHAHLAGIETANIFVTQRLSQLPGFFRPTKAWDLLVVVEHHLLAAIELKSQVGPSFGNNFNNRAEEVLGSAVDLWTAYREGAIQIAPPPWVGYLFLLEDCPQSRATVAAAEPHFSVRPEFRGASYAARYELLCRKLVLERHYTSACFLMADRDQADASPNYTEPAEDLSARLFLTQFTGHLAASLSAL